MQYVHISRINGEVDKAALIFDREEIETILHALNIAGALHDTALYDDLHDEIERMVFTND